MVVICIYLNLKKHCVCTYMKKECLQKCLKWLYANYVGWEKLVLRKSRNFTFLAVLLDGWGMCSHERCDKCRPAWNGGKLKESFARYECGWRSVCVCVCLFTFVARQPLVGHWLLIAEASWSHSDTSRWLGIPWTSDQPESETYAWRHKILTRDRHLCPGEIVIRNPRKRSPSGALGSARVWEKMRAYRTFLRIGSNRRR
jgi:hypothetical protein